MTTTVQDLIRRLISTEPDSDAARAIRDEAEDAGLTPLLDAELRRQAAAQLAEADALQADFAMRNGPLHKRGVQRS